MHNDNRSETSFYFVGISKINSKIDRFRFGKSSFRTRDLPSTYPYRDGPIEAEQRAAEKHRQRVKKEFWALVFNCPLKFFKFRQQRNHLLREIVFHLSEGCYLTNVV